MTILPISAQAELSEDPAVIQIFSSEKRGHVIVVQKSTQQLTVYSLGDTLKNVAQFPCSTGKQKGRKKAEGDAKTPSGIYFATGEFLDRDLSDIYGNRAFPLDYPNARDRKEGLTGSAIWLHGTDQALQPYQTNGCIALDNQNIDALKAYIRFNRTPVILIDSLKDIYIVKNGIWQAELLNLIETRNASIESGTYHEFLSVYKPDFLPNLAWWPPWIAFRAKGGGASVNIEGRDLLAVSIDRDLTALFDQYVLWRGKEVLTGSLKLFLQPYRTQRRISAEEYQTTPFNIINSNKREFPILFAAKSFSDSTNATNKIASIVDSWLRAWSNKDITKYASYYSRQFRSYKDQTLAEWIAYKQSLNRRYKYIKVTRKGLKIDNYEQSISATFVQHYKSDQFVGVTKKTLVFGLENGNWKILKEIT
jgi:murein L,D-transpeptidase YafK